MIYDLSCWGVQTAEEVSRYLHQPLIYKSTSSWSQTIYYKCCTRSFYISVSSFLFWPIFDSKDVHTRWGPVGISYSDFYAEYAHCVYLNINQICAYCIQIGKYPNTLCVFSQISTHPVFVNYALNDFKWLKIQTANSNRNPLKLINRL